MPQFDLALDDLRDYQPAVRRPDDFDEFWARTLSESRSASWRPQTQRVETGLRLVDTYDLTFAGFGGHPIKGWIHVPAGDHIAQPTVVEYLGYSGGRMLPWTAHTYAEAGYTHIVMDSRGQGWNGGVGATPDPTNDAGSSTVPGVMTKGIESAETYYYRRLYTDAALIVDAARALPWVDPHRIALVGTSQGGGLAIAAAGLSDGIAAVSSDVPFLSHFARALQLTDLDPYGEIARYLARYRDRVEQTFEVLSYVDGVNMAARADAPALFSVGLCDLVCPPSTVFAAYNAWGSSQREIEVYPFNGHDGGGEHHMPRRLAFLAEHLLAP
ncbi:acetylxylan esterase [Microbacterium sp. JZ70]